MAVKSVSFIMISSFLLASSVLFGVSTAFGGRKALAPGGHGVDMIPAANPPDSGIDFGFVPLNTKDPKVVALAKFAIDEYNKEHKANLVYDAVFEAISTEDAQGTKYGLVVAATNNKVLNDYSVSVVVAKNSEKVVAFQQNK